MSKIITNPKFLTENEGVRFRNKPILIQSQKISSEYPVKTQIFLVSKRIAKNICVFFQVPLSFYQQGTFLVESGSWFFFHKRSYVPEPVM